jgi:hypothetical protein
MSTQPARWIGVDPSGIIELTGKLDNRALYAAEYLADAIIDGKGETAIRLEREHYERTRAEARRVRDLYHRLYGSGAVGRFAGYLVRSRQSVSSSTVS